MNQDAMRSAARPRRGRCARACSSIRTSACSVDSCGALVTSSSSIAPALIEPPSSSSPVARRCGIDSPVTSDSSTTALAEQTRPSTGITAAADPQALADADLGERHFLHRAVGGEALPVAGSARARASVTLAAWCRPFISNQRPSSRTG